MHANKGYLGCIKAARIEKVEKKKSTTAIHKDYCCSSPSWFALDFDTRICWIAAAIFCCTFLTETVNMDFSLQQK